MEAAVKAADWDAYSGRLIEYVNALAETQKLAWSELIGDLIRQWDAKHAGITPAKKRESMEHVLGSAGANPETLFNRLQSLLRNWSQGREADMALEGLSLIHI